MKKRSKKQAVFTFESSRSAEELLADLPAQLSAYGRERDTDLRFETSEGGNRFRLGLERAGHSSGYWYCAKMQPVNGSTRISGEIILDPDENDQERKQEGKTTFGEWVEIVLFSIVVIIPALLIFAVLEIARWIRRKPRPPEKEELLTDFMTNVMHCTQIKQENADV